MSVFCKLFSTCAIHTHVGGSNGSRGQLVSLLVDFSETQECKETGGKDHCCVVNCRNSELKFEIMQE